MFGVLSGKNEHVLRTTLQPGVYRIIIYGTSPVSLCLCVCVSLMLCWTDNGYRDPSLFACSPFSLSLLVRHIPEAENGVSCSCACLHSRRFF